MAEQFPQTVEIKLEDFFTKVLSMIGKVTDEQLAELLKNNSQTIAVAESLTGGLISSHLTSLPGSSAYFIGGIVCYHNRTKVMQLGLTGTLISDHGVASKEVAIAMAENVRKRFHADIGLGITGVAGPAPLPPTPVGRVFIALASEKGDEWKELHLQGTRTEIREKATQAALGLLWLHVGGDEVF
ncbi:MAG: CinA family protein [bacterium]